MTVVALSNQRLRAAPGFVYFLRCGDLVKIGFSREPDVRARNIGTMSPVGLEVVGVHPGSRLDEAMLHEMFSAKRQHGEWFEWCPQIADIAQNGLPLLPNPIAAPEESSSSRATIAPIVCGVVRRKLPFKTANELALRTGCSIRNCEMWLSGRQEMMAPALVALLLSDLGDEIWAALETYGAQVAPTGRNRRAVDSKGRGR